MSTTPNSARLPETPWFALLLSIFWLVAFTALFYASQLSNNPSLSRLDLWALLPDLLVSAFAPAGTAPPGTDETLVGWRFVAQRGEFYALAGLVLLGAAGVGGLLLRPLGLLPLLDRLERRIFAVALGLAALSLWTLCCGLLGWLAPAAFWAPMSAAVAANARFAWARPSAAGRQQLPEAGRAGAALWNGWALAAATPFLLAILLGAPLPSIDFDVNEYHFLGPKEFFQAGRIRFLPHNVYTSFPFGTEMLTLLAMVLRQDWYWGALAGKCVLATFGLLTPLALFGAGRRWFSAPVGALAALVYVSAPWTYRISTTAYAEGGLSFYLFMALYACGIAIEAAKANGAPKRTGRLEATRAAFASGLLAGAAMSCKYPALVSVVVPLFVAVTSFSMILREQIPAARESSNEPAGRRPRAAWARLPAAFLAGAAITVGPWLLKNLVETGNPVYPLAFRLFGGADWNAALDQKWRQAHSASTHTPGSLVSFLLEVVARNDWQSPMYFGLAPLALLEVGARRKVYLLGGYLAWLALGCWALTHRIDRFWVPMLPVAAMLAGLGGWRLWQAVLSWAQTAGARWLGGMLLAATLVLALAFNLGLAASAIGGNNSYFLELNHAAKLAAALTAPEIVHLNSQLPEGARVLAVGDAEMFEARFPVVYNTVFDKCIFEEWLALPEEGAGARREFASLADINRKLADERITHVYVNWLEILRYRSRGNYGFTPFVTPERFEWLRRSQVLGKPWSIPEAWLPVEKFNEGWRDEATTWGQALLSQRGETLGFTTFQVFPVLAAEPKAGQVDH